jgi:hypothetical protein
MKFLTRREDMYDVTDSSCVSVKFQSRVLRFYSTDDTSVRYYMSSQFFSRFHYIVAHSLGFVGHVCSTNMYLLLYPSSMHVRALSQLLL